MEKISWTDCVGNEVLLRMNDERNNVRKIKMSRTNCA